MRIVCDRCRRPQENRTATVDNPEHFYLGCRSCGYPYGHYAKEKDK